MLGLRRLGWDVLLLDRLDPGMVADEERSVRYVTEVMRAFGLEDAYALELDGGARRVGPSRADVLERVRTAPMLLNVMGFVEDEEILGAAQRRVFLDTDPGFGQMWRDLGLADLFAGHDAFVTIAERIGQPDCTIPTCGLDWITWRQPVVLERWPAATAAPVRGFTGIGSWRGPYAPVEHGGHTYGLRVHEFRKFADVPRRAGGAFEVALDIDPVETRDLELLAAGGWTVVDPGPVGDTPASYRDYLAGSTGELMVAKGMYVDSRSGWFSERSIDYLASGRPVVAQDTGLDGLYPLGEGLLAFTTADEAVAAVAEVRGDYARHARAARALAEELFDSDRVLARLLADLGIA